MNFIWDTNIITYLDELIENNNVNGLDLQQIRNIMFEEPESVIQEESMIQEEEPIKIQEEELNIEDFPEEDKNKL